MIAVVAAVQQHMACDWHETGAENRVVKPCVAAPARCGRLPEANG